MRIYEYTNDNWGRAFKKISKAFHDYSPPSVEWVNSPENSDINIVHVVGKGEERYLKQLKNKIIIQHCYFTAGIDKVNYAKYWKDSLLTISFHNLPDYTDEKFSFYRMPWGADPNIYNLNNKYYRPIKVFTTGHIAETESIDLVYEAAKKSKHKMYNTGKNFKWDSLHYQYLDFLPEEGLADLLNHTQFVTGLRKIEGFEIMSIEGLFCGARPIVYDLPTYDLYKEHAIVIDPNKDIIETLTNIFRHYPRSMSDSENRQIIEKFSWENIVKRMFKRINHEVH
jgi:glycosyltransferase involved in cell wall biosynthesis